MTVATQARFPIINVMIAVLAIVTICTLSFFIRWFLAEVKEPADQISGMALGLTFVTSMAGLIWFLFQQNQKEANTSKESAEEVFKSRILLIRKSRTDAEEVLTDDELIALMPPQLQAKSKFYIQESRLFEDYLDICQSVADHLSSNEQQLEIIAKAAADDVLNKLRATQLERLGLVSEASREGFYSDLYLYLKVWLVLSIEYLQPMPTSRIQRSVVDRRLYTETFTYIRDERIQWFHLPDRSSEEIVKEYLQVLICKLDQLQD